MGQFVSQSKTLKGGCYGLSKVEYHFSDTFHEGFKVHLLLMYCIKNLSIGVS